MSLRIGSVSAVASGRGRLCGAFLGEFRRGRGLEMRVAGCADRRSRGEIGGSADGALEVWRVGVWSCFILHVR